MDLTKLITLKEIEEKYGVKPATIRSYVNREKVIPEDKILKIGSLWFIDRAFAEEKWGNKKD